MIEMFYEKQKKFFNRKWQKGSGKTVVTVNKKTISALKKWQRSTICLGIRKTSYTLFIHKKRKRASSSRNLFIFRPEIVTKVS